MCHRPSNLKTRGRAIGRPMCLHPRPAAHYSKSTLNAFEIPLIQSSWGTMSGVEFGLSVFPTLPDMGLTTMMTMVAMRVAWAPYPKHRSSLHFDLHHPLHLQWKLMLHQMTQALRMTLLRSGKR